MISDYEKKRDLEFATPLPADKEKIIWLGGDKINLSNKKIGWFYMGEFYEAGKNAGEIFFRGKGLCVLP